MPFCPDCHEEYDAGIAACADCGSTLVETLGRAEDAPVDIPIAVKDAEVAKRFVSLLIDHGVQAVPTGEMVEWNGSEYPTVRIPTVAAELTAMLVGQSASFHMIEQDEWGRGVVDFFEMAGGTIDSHPLLKKSPKEIVAMGPDVLPELENLALDGVKEVSRWACRRLVDFGEAAETTLSDMCERAVEHANRDAVYGIVGAVDEAAKYGPPPAVRPPASVDRHLADDEAAVRSLAALVLGRFGGPEHVSKLIESLHDDEPLVVEEVVEALDSLTGIDLDLAGDADEAERETAVARMRRWLQERQSGAT